MRPDGTQTRFVVNGQSSLNGCRSLLLPVDIQQIEALYPLPHKSVPGDTILLQGELQEGSLAAASVTLPGAEPSSSHGTPMPLHINLLPLMHARSFGIEERVQVGREGDRLQVDCAPGNKPAGVVLSGPWYMPRAHSALQISFTGTGAFGWQVADAVHAAMESDLEMERITARNLSQNVRMRFPRNLDRPGWKQFTILCPPQQGNLVLNTLELVTTEVRTASRSTWVWRTQDWQQHGQLLLEWAQKHAIGELFVTVPVEENRVRDSAALAAFVRQGSDRGMAVWAVDGDPHMVLPAEQGATVQRAHAYAAYNASAEPVARLRGIQFDIEPHLLRGYDVADAEWDRRYLELASALRRAVETMQLEFVVPYWWGDKAELLRSLAQSADSLAVMDYRTAPQEIYRFAVPFLDWANVHGKRVRIALEAGPIASETQKRYLRAGKSMPGELLLIRMEETTVLLLLKEARAYPGAEAFRLTASRVIDGTGTTFHADKSQLERILPQLEQDFSAWSGFAGMALHEFR